MSFVLLIVKALYFFVPAYVANMMPVLFRRLPLFSSPISLRYFGAHKTYRGLVVAILSGSAVYVLQGFLYDSYTLFRTLSIIDYSSPTLVCLGFLLATGAICGDLFESYIKRKMGMASGTSWVPFDQLDFVLGALFCSLFVYVIAAKYLLVIVLISPLLHILINHLAYAVHIRSEKW